MWVKKSDIFNNIVGRTYIAECYNNFNPQYFRFSFAKKLLESYKSSAGQWPDDKLPYKDEKSGTLIAKFEEKMLGLYR